MRFPSLDLVASQTARVVRRFPLVVLSAVTAAIAGMVLIEAQSNDTEVPLRLWILGALGIPGLLGPALLSGRGLVGVGRGLQAAVLLLLALVFFQWTSWTEPEQARRYFQLSLGMHLAVAAVPFVRHGKIVGFWQYNAELLLRFLQSALFSVVLFGGLAVALLALDNLFGLDVDGNVYVHLGMLIGLVFNTIYFLGGIHEPLSDLDQLDTYPRALKIFAQYILMPIVALYLIILTAYLGKVLVTRAWPSGWIGYLVSSVSLTGMLSLLLLYPIQHWQENRWVASYGRWFYVALLPSIGMLLMAVGKRIGQYGVTENRYFLLVLTLWLAGIALYFILSRSRNIKWIPITLGAVVLLTSFGPWGAYSVSQGSQARRFERLLESNDRLSPQGIAVASAAQLDRLDERELGATLHYLVANHGRQAVAPWFPQFQPTGGQPWNVETPTRGQAHTMTVELLSSIGVEWNPHDPRTGDEFLHFNTTEPLVLDVRDYDFAVRIDLHQQNRHITLGSKECTIVVEDAGPNIALDCGEGAETLIDVADLRQRIRAIEANVSKHALIYDLQTRDWDLKLAIHTAAGRHRHEETSFHHVDATLFASRR